MNQTEFMKTFQEFYDYLMNKKGNQLSVSNTTYPKRVYIDIKDLSSQPNGGRYKIPTNFTGMQVERIYSTSNPSVNKSGSVKVVFDDDNISNISNGKTLFASDSFTFLDGAVANAWLVWDNQVDTSIQLAFFIDLDYRAGTTKSEIVGNVNIVNTNASALYQKPSLPTNITNIQAIGTNANLYTIPANRVAILNYAVFFKAGSSASVRVNGVELVSANTGSTSDVFACGKITLKSGDVISSALGVGTLAAGLNIEEYSI